MKKRTFLFTTAFISLLTTSIFAQNSPLLCLVSDMATTGASQITLHVDAKIEVATWDHDYLKVEIQITKSNFTHAQLKSLVAMGFYQVKALGNAANLVLNMPSQLIPVQINGIQPSNEMTFKITVPSYVTVTQFGNPTDLLAGQ